MRSALRGATVGTVAIGLLASTVALGVPVGATTTPAPAKTTARLVVTHTPYVGKTCTVGVTLTKATGQIGGANVTIQTRLKGAKSWTYLHAVKTKSSGTTKSNRLNSTRAVQFRAVYAGATGLKADISNVVTCTPKTLRPGVKSSSVLKLQKKLKSLRIRPASTSGTYDYNTLEAVYAYQKSRLLKRTGTVNGALFDKILATKKLTPSAWCKSTDTICIDLSKQVGYLKIGGGQRYTIPISSGGGYYYYQDGNRNFAHTPKGTFHVYYKVPGATKGPLGVYYYISFFTGGYGVHGSASVPPYAASHGCVREPRTIERWVYAHLPIGAQVHVHQ